MRVGVSFDSAWRQRCRVEPCSIIALDCFVKAHYLHKRPAIVTLSLVMFDRFVPVGCAIFAAPPREVNKRFGGETWELARLYVLDTIPKNAETWLIGQSVRYVTKHHRSVRFLISYADPSVGHSGTIYRAANWLPDGMTDDERKTPRFDYADLSGKRYGRAGNIPAGVVVVRRPRTSKYRFVMPLKALPHGAA